MKLKNFLPFNFKKTALMKLHHETLYVSGTPISAIDISGLVINVLIRPYRRHSGCYLE